MKFVFLVICYILIISNILFSNQIPDPRVQGCGGTSMLLNGKAATILYNPSLLILNDNADIYASYSQEYNLESLHIGTFSGSFLIKEKKIAIASSFLNLEGLYSEGEFAIGSGFEFRKDFYLSLASKVFFVDQGIDYGSDFAWNVNMGILYKLNKNVFVDISVKDLLMNNPFNEFDYYSRVFSVGAFYKPLENIKIRLELESEKDFPLLVQIAQEMILYNSLAIRIGFSSEPVRFSLGFGFFFNGFASDFSYRTHRYLGGSKVLGCGKEFL